MELNGVNEAKLYNEVGHHHLKKRKDRPHNSMLNLPWLGKSPNSRLKFFFSGVKVVYMSKTTTCPGCGLILPSGEEQLAEHYYASYACRQLYYEFTGYTLSLGDGEFIHQYAVDTYAAQHAGANAKPIGITFALAGLYLAHEHGYTGKQVQIAHRLLAKATLPYRSLSFCLYAHFTS